jgi:hypothetical protein
MYHKLIIYPETKPIQIIDNFLGEHFKKDQVFYLNEKKYKVLDIRFTAKEVNFDQKGNPIYENLPNPVNPLKHSIHPELIVTEIPSL